ncbi:MAG: hypothetical protein ABII82_20830 [Verrucomicrobiota bacterium]
MLLSHLSDLLRLPWAHVYWNIRKARWVSNGRRGRCPCLNPSDPSGPGQARCEAVVHWHRPARFQSVCPLLVRDQGEWRCSGGSAGARPFWRRALSRLLTLAAACLLILLFTIQGLLWAGGVRGVTPLDLLLPQRWQHVRIARAEAFHRLAMDALRAGRHQEMMLALATAEDTAPGANLDTGLLSMRLAEHRRNHAITDRLHRHLLDHYPDQHDLIKLSYHDALLVSGRWPDLARACLDNLSPSAPDAVAWLRSLALATHHLPDRPAFADARANTIDALPPAWRAQVRMLLLNEAPDLTHPGDQHGTLATVAIEHAARTGDAMLAADAFGALATRPDTLRDLRLQNRYRLRFPRSSRDPSALRATLTDLATSPDALQTLLADALRSDDAAWLTNLAARLPDNISPQCAGDLWLAATVLGADPVRRLAETRLQTGGRVPPSYFQLAARRDHGAADWTQWITVIPCSREMLFTLAELRPAAQSSAP